MELWDRSYPGIYIDPRTFNEYSNQISGLGPGEGRVFISATRACLVRIRSQPIGSELLTLISKRCQGIGTSTTGLKCRIMFGQGTLTNRHGTRTPDRYARTASHRTGAFPDLDFTQPEDVLIAQMARQHRISRTSQGRTLATAGKGISAVVSFNPLINYDVATFTLMLVENPAFVALAHELVHAFHTLSGDVIPNADPDKEKMIEEARTVGAGKYAGTRISENTIRDEHGYTKRAFYAQPGDCDAAALA